MVHRIVVIVIVWLLVLAALVGSVPLGIFIEVVMLAIIATFLLVVVGRDK